MSKYFLDTVNNMVDGCKVDFISSEDFNQSQNFVILDSFLLFSAIAFLCRNIKSKKRLNVARFNVFWKCSDDIFQKTVTFTSSYWSTLNIHVKFSDCLRIRCPKIQKKIELRLAILGCTARPLAFISVFFRTLKDYYTKWLLSSL